MGGRVGWGTILWSLPRASIKAEYCAHLNTTPHRPALPSALEWTKTQAEREREGGSHAEPTHTHSAYVLPPEHGIWQSGHVHTRQWVGRGPPLPSPF